MEEPLSTQKLDPKGKYAITTRKFSDLLLRGVGAMSTTDQAGTSSDVGSSDASEGKPSNAVALAKKLIHHRMLVGIKDGRFFVGMFYCMDKQGNIILQDAVEYRSKRRSSPTPMEHKGVGLILIPSSCRTSCHVDCTIQEQLSLLSIKDQL